MQYSVSTVYDGTGTSVGHETISSFLSFGTALFCERRQPRICKHGNFNPRLTYVELIIKKEL